MPSAASTARPGPCPARWVVLVPHLPRTGAHGATRWLTADRALVQMSIRGRWDDVFWFSLFHGLGHVLLHGRNLVFIEGYASAAGAPEHEADAFAADTLIPPADYRAFRNASSRPTTIAVRALAEQLGVSPSIVVGRLHHDDHVPHSHLNDLRTQLNWTHD